MLVLFGPVLFYMMSLFSPFLPFSATGIIAAVAGIGIAARQGERRALCVLAPILLTHALVGFVALNANQVLNPGPLLNAFMGAQLLLAAAGVAVCNRSRLAGLLLGWFGLTYAVPVAFISAMSLSGIWL
jgi:hypothetical protein